MSDFSSMGKWLVVMGLVVAAIGALIWLSGKVPLLGRLPGDIKIESEHFKFYFPLASCLVLSAVGSLILWILSKFK